MLPHSPRPCPDFRLPVQDKLIDINIKACFMLTKEALPYLRFGSSICYVSSIGAYEPSPPIGGYTICKTALLGMTKVAAKELLPMGIRVNCLAPGVIKVCSHSLQRVRVSECRMRRPGTLLPRWVPMWWSGRITPRRCAFRVSVVCTSQTALSRMLWEGSESAAPESSEDFGMGPLGVPSDCAGAVAFLCCSDARFISGETIMATGVINSRL